MFCGDPGQAEGSPVGEAADNTAGADDLGTGVTGDSVERILVFEMTD
jgi:hypothetical protein